MADNKTYYYMRLKENFFDGNELAVIEAMPDGFLYSNILLKMYLKSLRDEGRLMIGTIPYDAKMIAGITHHKVKTVKKALELFEKVGLIEILDNGAIYMLDIQNFIGKSTTEADRKRSYRERIERERDKCPDISTPEIEIELRDNNTPLTPQGVERVSNPKYRPEWFERFYALYPRKTARKKAAEAWDKLKPDRELCDVMEKAIRAQMNTEQWENPQHIPHPSTWLNGARWQDEVKGGKVDEYPDL